MKYLLIAAAVYAVIQAAVAIYEGEKMVRMSRKYGHLARYMKGWPK